MEENREKNNEVIVGGGSVSECVYDYNRVTHGEEAYYTVKTLMEYEGKIYILELERQSIYTGDEGGMYSLGAGYSRFHDINDMLAEFNIPTIGEARVSVCLDKFDDVKLINEDGTLSEVDPEVRKKVSGFKEIEVYTNAEEFLEVDEEENYTLKEWVLEDENKKYSIERTYDEVEIKAGNIQYCEIPASIEKEGDKTIIKAYGKVFDYDEMEKARELKEAELTGYIEEDKELDETLSKAQELEQIKESENKLAD